MDSVFQKIEEIERTAESIVKRAEDEKSMTDQQLQDERDKFDADLADKTEKKLNEIRQASDAKMKQIMDDEKKRHHFVIDNLEEDFKENHEAYAKEILENIIKV